jgi:thiamine biosynthesis protein ThiC
MDFPSRKELLANNFEGRGADAASRAAMAAWLGADSLEYLSADGLLACAGMDQMKMSLTNAREAIGAAHAAKAAAASASAPGSSASASSSAATDKKLEICIDGDESSSSSAASASSAASSKPYIPSWCTACFSAVYPVPIAELVTPVAGCGSKDW